MPLDICAALTLQVYLCRGHGPVAARRFIRPPFQALGGQRPQGLPLLHPHLLPLVAGGGGHPGRHRPPRGGPRVLIQPLP